MLLWKFTNCCLITIFHQTGVTHEDSIRTTAEALLKDNPDASNYYLVGAIQPVQSRDSMMQLV